MSCLHTAIPTPSFCSFWHGHPYIPIHFLKMFFILVAIWSTKPDHKRVHTCRCRLLRVILAYRDTPTQGIWGRTGSPGTVRVTLAYRDTPTRGTWGRTGSPGIVPGLSELLWHTGILRHRVPGEGMVVPG